MVKTQKKMRVKLNHKKTKKAFHTWNGHGLDILFGLVYLLDKYDSLCFPLNNPNNQLRSITLSMICKKNVKNAFKKDHYTFRFPVSSEKLVSMVEKCAVNNRFIALPLYIIFDDCKLKGHLNIILFDTEKKEIERFDSYGTNGYTEKEKKPLLWFDEYFITWLNDNNLDYKYNSTKNGPLIGPQELEELQIDNKINMQIVKETDPDGFCGIWCILFIEYRLKNPDMKYKDVMKLMMKDVKKNNKIIRDWIRNYLYFITKQRDLFLKKMKINKVQQNIWLSELEKVVETIFNKRIYKE